LGRELATQPDALLHDLGPPLLAPAGAVVSHDDGRCAVSDIDPPPIKERFIKQMIQNHSIAVESLTEKQLAGVIRQMIASGDFLRFVSFDGSAQGMTYEPYRERDALAARVRELESVVSMYGRIESLCFDPGQKGNYRFSARVLIVEGGDVTQVFYGKTPLDCVKNCDALLVKGGAK
jgi:hypothetical protein